MDQRLALGRAIAERRRWHGLSQAELARLLDRPAAWVSLMERGLVQAEPWPVLEAVASALGTPLPARPGARLPGPARRGGPGAADALRLVLSGGAQRSEPRGAVPTPALRADADLTWALTCEGRYGELADLLGRLLPGLTAALRAGAGAGERAALHALVATCYQACSAALARLGEHESAKAAVSRALCAAQRAGDLPLAAASAYLLARILMEMGRYPQADETAGKAAAALAPLAAEGRPEAISVQGGLILLRALIAARTGDPCAARGHLDRAGEQAGRLAAARSGLDTGFGPAHVALYEIAVSVETSSARDPRRGGGAGPGRLERAS
jgi:tetratricopeptide (TPR) repeat protein